jgi:hypothetical protein
LAGDTKHGVKGHKEARADGQSLYKGGIGVLPLSCPIFIRFLYRGCCRHLEFICEA